MELSPYQVEGANWLSKKKYAFLADEMGLGKTAQAILAADNLGIKRMFVVCPAVARVNWLREFEKFSSLRRSFVIVDSKTSVWKQDDSIIISYELATQTEPMFFGRFGLAILDEAHYLKSTTSKRSGAILGSDGLIHNWDRLWALSGTPAPNNVSEIWIWLYLFGATTLSLERFIKVYCNYYQGPRGPVATGTKKRKLTEIKAMISQVFLRREKADVLSELPAISFEEVIVPPAPVNIDEYGSFIEWVFPKDRTEEFRETLSTQQKLVAEVLGGSKYGEKSLEILKSLATSVSTLRRYNGLEKMPSCAEIIARELEANAYDKIVIFAIHADVIEGLRKRLSLFGARTLYGGTPPKKRQQNIDDFQTRRDVRVMVCNIQAAGTAINLTAAHQVAFVEQDWVPGNNAQAAMRCHRRGQTKPVSVRFFSLADSIDEKVSTILRRKTKEISEIGF